MSEAQGSVKGLVKDIFNHREYSQCWYSDDEGDTGDCGNWPTCDPHCPLRRLADLVGIKPQADGGVDKQEAP
jgi:hypothetical protein